MISTESIEIINQLLHTPWAKDIHFLKGDRDEDEDNSDHDPWLKIDLADEKFSKQLHEKTKGIGTNMIITVPDEDGRARQKLAQEIRYHANILGDHRKCTFLQLFECTFFKFLDASFLRPWMHVFGRKDASKKG